MSTDPSYWELIDRIKRGETTEHDAEMVNIMVETSIVRFNANRGLHRTVRRLRALLALAVGIGIVAIILAIIASR
jgi:hypothetical protein